MDLGDGDRPEHLPYVRAGFAVLAYELDGVLPKDRETRPDDAADPARGSGSAAQAGLVNARIALDYALAKVAGGRPRARSSSAGHSSAGTLAILFAENEPRLRGGVAYAPASTWRSGFGPAGVLSLRALGLGDLATTYSPKANEAKLDLPAVPVQRPGRLQRPGLAARGLRRAG